MPETLLCEYCGKRFEINPYRKDTARFCSYNCKGLWMSENQRGNKNPSWDGGKEISECEGCGKLFKAWSSEERRFCSRDCYGNYLSQSELSRKHYAETLAKYKEENGSWNKGKINVYDEETKRSMAYWLGKTMSEETKHKMSESQSGEKHWNWKGGGYYYYGPNWKKTSSQIRKRANNLCEICNTLQIKPRLDVHHIIPFHSFDSREEANSKTNLIALCKSCHMKTELNGGLM